MLSNNKQFRYYYWLITAFFKKNAKIILISFTASIILVIGVISVFPYFVRYTTTKREVIGIVGSFTTADLPDEIVSKISNGLVVIDPNGDVKPVLADRWTVADNGKTYRLYLKKSIFWNDSKPFKASEINYEFKDVESNVLSDDIIEFKLKKALPIFPTYLSKSIIRAPLIGVAGLYKVDHIKSKYDAIQEISLSPNKEGLPYFTYKFYSDEAKLVNAYKLSEINQFRINKKSIADMFRSWNNTEVTESVDYGLLLTLFINMKNDKLREAKELREAIAMSIDRSKFQENGVEAIGPIPPISWGYNPNLKPVPLNQDLAKKMVNRTKDASDEAAIELSASYEYTNIAQALREDFSTVGLDVRLKTIGFSDTEDYDLLLAYWKVPLDPDQYYFWHSTQTQGNVTNYKNVKIDKLLEDGRNVSGVQPRRDAYLQFQRIIQDDIPAVFLYYPYTYSVKRK